ncbi:hypothetical protein NDU88_012249 [Pleurodeles waltl]|uniref:Uncharacterized protein n=1 Tax=Pleurodeles waltl TaxID=8319 RepID=A0AAV7R047_PLEWA|nr:hypothetical protein NDU88_012249 [Pleurodeles waltl]
MPWPGPRKGWRRLFPVQSQLLAYTLGGGRLGAPGLEAAGGRLSDARSQESSFGELDTERISGSLLSVCKLKIGRQKLAEKKIETNSDKSV